MNAGGEAGDDARPSERSGWWRAYVRFWFIRWRECECVYMDIGVIIPSEATSTPVWNIATACYRRLLGGFELAFSARRRRSPVRRRSLLLSGLIAGGRSAFGCSISEVGRVRRRRRRIFRPFGRRRLTKKVSPFRIKKNLQSKLKINILLRMNSNRSNFYYIHYTPPIRQRRDKGLPSSGHAVTWLSGWLLAEYEDISNLWKCM